MIKAPAPAAPCLPSIGRAAPTSGPRKAKPGKGAQARRKKILFLQKFFAPPLAGLAAGRKVAAWATDTGAGAGSRAFIPPLPFGREGADLPSKNPCFHFRRALLPRKDRGRKYPPCLCGAQAPPVVLAILKNQSPARCGAFRPTMGRVSSGFAICNFSAT